LQRHGFEMHDIFCSAPGNLVEELDAFYAVAGEVNEAVGAPYKTLLAGLCLKSDNLIFTAANAAKDNIRYCSFFVQLLKDSWGPVGLFRELYDVAESCLKDDQAPMRGIAVFVKPPGTAAVPAGSAIFHYETIESFQSQLRAVLTDWLTAVLPQAPDPPA